MSPFVCVVASIFLRVYLKPASGRSRNLFYLIYLFIIAPDGSQPYSYTNNNAHSYTEIKKHKNHANDKSTWRVL